jgi:hypothetical protein
MVPPHRSVPHLYAPKQKGHPNAASPPFPPPILFCIGCTSTPPPLPSNPRPLRLTGAPSCPPDLAVASPPTRPPGELRLCHHCLSLEPHLTFPSSSCRTAGTLSPATGAPPPPQNVTTHCCHHPRRHRPAASVSSHPYDLARRVDHLAVVLTTPTSSPGSSQRARPGHATAIAMDAVTALHARSTASGGTGRPGHCTAGPGQRPEAMGHSAAQHYAPRF